MKCIFMMVYMISAVSATVPKDICDTCVPSHNCPLFGNLSKKEQRLWQQRFPCRSPDRKIGYSGTLDTNTNYVCCSNNVWGIENSEQSSPAKSHEPLSELVHAYGPDYSHHRKDPYAQNQGDWNFYNYNYPLNYTTNYDRRFYTNNNDYIGRTRQNQGDNDNFNYNNRNLSDNNTKYNTIENAKTNNWNNNRRYWNDRPDREWNYRNQNTSGRNTNNQNRRYVDGNKIYWNTRRQPRPQTGNNSKPYNQNNFGNNSRKNAGNNNNRTGDSTGQCVELTSSPPDPRSGCCGREVADDDRITDARSNITPARLDYWARPQSTPGFRRLRDDDQPSTWTNTSDFPKIESQISGGEDTELYQYPWTVLLLTTFDYGNRLAGFNCGGSLISSKYVLSAGHCVYDKDAVVKSVEVNLAEYDKRTFPRDCKASSNGWKCIENRILYAEDIIIHPKYENENLLNDISLIRLQGTAPYTDYIRPICLPSINVDEPEFSNLQFEVAGWGRDGPYRSDIKQSTVLHLVNQNECRRFYPMLTTKHLCATGYKGEDTCKGDSGGPLMTLYRGRYYATGVVSGKRADSPCGTAVPSLFTNVYHYLDWIRSNIKN